MRNVLGNETRLGVGRSRDFIRTKTFLLCQQTKMSIRDHKVLLVLEVEKGGCKKKLWSLHVD